MLKGLSFLIYTFMDKQLLEALNNLSDSLEMISKALEKKDSSNTTTTNALQSGNFSKQLTEITVSLKSIKSDTKKILEKQNTILEMQKQKDSDKKNAIDETGEDPKKQSDLKKGVTTILLIAVAVLAIGLAFKIIGKVDFLSVVSLGLAIVLISHAFQKVAEAKITVEEAIVAGKVMVIMSIAIMLSSWVLSFIKPISFGQSITAILIAGMFTVIAFGIKKLINALGENIGTLVKAIVFLPILLPAIALGITLSSWVLAFINPISFGQAITAILIAGMFTVIAFGIKKLINALGADITTLGKAILFLPLILPAIALGIAASSWVLQMIVPISFAQAITGILIAAMFTVISFGIKKLIGAFKGLDPAEVAIAAISMPLLLIAMSMAIAASSFFLAKITPIGFDQFLTAIGISIVFVVLAFALKLMTPAIEKIKPKDVIILPLLFTTLSLAIMLSSKILAQTTPIDYALLFNIVVFSIVFAISAIAMGFAAFVLAKIGVKKIIEGGLCIVILAAVVAASSLLVAEGKYDTYPGMDWLLGTGASILAFGLIATIFGLIIESGIGGAALALGAAAILVLAAVIVATSLILGLGAYENYPSVSWALGVGLSLAAFGIGAVLLGTQVLNPFFYAGLGVILLVAATVVGVSLIFGLGNFDVGKFPSIQWAMGATAIILGLALIATAIAPLAAFIIIGAVSILAVAATILAVDKIFEEGKYKKFPNEDWLKGATKTILDTGLIAVGLSIFLPLIVLGALSILAVATTLLGVDKIFEEGKFKKFPSKDWIDGVANSITGFVKIMDDTSFLSVLKGGLADFFGGGVTDVAEAIVDIDKVFSKGLFTSYPSKDWINSVAASFKGFSNIAKTASGIGIIAITKINLVTRSLINTAKTIANNKRYFTTMNTTFVTSLTRNLTGYRNLSSRLASTSLMGLAKTNLVALSLVKVAKTIWSGRQYFSKNIDPNYMKNLSKNVMDYAKLANYLTSTNKNSGVFGGVKSLLGLDPISQAAKGMITIAGAYDKLATSLKKFGGALSSIDGKKVNLIRNLTGNLAVLASMNQDNLENMMKTLEERASVFSKLVEYDGTKTKRPAVGDKKAAPTTPGKPGGKSKMDTHAQLDMIIQLLGNINQTTMTLDQHVSGAAEGKVQTTSVSGGGNSGGGGWFNW
jgi:hypothetical protein